MVEGEDDARRTCPAPQPRAAGPGPAGDDLPLDDQGPDGVDLPTRVVLARSAEAADSAEQAERSGRERLTATRGLTPA